MIFFSDFQFRATWAHCAWLSLYRVVFYCKSMCLHVSVFLSLFLVLSESLSDPEELEHGVSLVMPALLASLERCYFPSTDSFPFRLSSGGTFLIQLKLMRQRMRDHRTHFSRGGPRPQLLGCCCQFLFD